MHTKKNSKLPEIDLDGLDGVTGGIGPIPALLLGVGAGALLGTAIAGVGSGRFSESRYLSYAYEEPAVDAGGGWDYVDYGGSDCGLA